MYTFSYIFCCPGNPSVTVWSVDFMWMSLSTTSFNEAELQLEVSLPLLHLAGHWGWHPSISKAQVVGKLHLPRTYGDTPRTASSRTAWPAASAAASWLAANFSLHSGTPNAVFVMRGHSFLSTVYMWTKTRNIEQVIKHQNVSKYTAQEGRRRENKNEHN